METSNYLVLWCSAEERNASRWVNDDRNFIWTILLSSQSDNQNGIVGLNRIIQLHKLCSAGRRFFFRRDRERLWLLWHNSDLARYSFSLMHGQRSMAAIRVREQIIPAILIHSPPPPANHLPSFPWVTCCNSFQPVNQKSSLTLHVQDLVILEENMKYADMFICFQRHRWIRMTWWRNQAFRSNLLKYYSLRKVLLNWLKIKYILAYKYTIANTARISYARLFSKILLLLLIK